MTYTSLRETSSVCLFECVQQRDQASGAFPFAHSSSLRDVMVFP